MGFRETKAQARSDLHEIMKVAALYFPTDVAEPIPLDVRVHTNFKAQGDLKGTSFSYAEQREELPKLLFWRSDLPVDAFRHPRTNALVTVAADEGYRIGHSDPPDGLTITAAVTRLTAAEMVGLPYPGS